MRPTESNFRSPKLRTGEYVLPNKTHFGVKMFNNVPVREKRIIKLRAGSRTPTKTDTTVIHTFSHEKRFRESDVSNRTFESKYFVDDAKTNKK